jgi:ADP-ribose pyrophosphatase
VTKREAAGQISSQRVYSGRIISVDLDEVRFPNGTSGKLEMVRHPGASAVVPFLDDPHSADPRIILIRQYRYAANGFVHEIPAGRLDQGENALECAARELREETGYSARELIPLTTFYTTPGFTDERIHLFAAVGLAEGESEPESDEILDLVSVPMSRAMEMIRAGELVDGKSMVGLFFASRFMRA